jgi:hypothetical protein
MTCPHMCLRGRWLVHILCGSEVDDLSTCVAQRSMYLARYSCLARCSCTCWCAGLVTLLGSLLLHLLMCLARYSTWIVALALVDVLGSLLYLTRCSCTCWCAGLVTLLDVRGVACRCQRRCLQMSEALLADVRGVACRCQRRRLLILTIPAPAPLLGNLFSRSRSRSLGFRSLGSRSHSIVISQHSWCL